MTSVSEPEGQIHLKFGGKHRLMTINQHTKFHQNRRWSRKFLIQLFIYYYYYFINIVVDYFI